MKNFYNFKVDNIKGLSVKEKEFRNKELDQFSKNGFPNKKEEAWKFCAMEDRPWKVYHDECFPMCSVRPLKRIRTQ